MRPNGAKSVEKLRRHYQKKGEKVGKNRFLRKIQFYFAGGGARLHFNAKRLGRPSFFIKRSNLSNIRVKSEGVVATVW